MRSIFPTALSQRYLGLRANEFSISGDKIMGFHEASSYNSTATHSITTTSSLEFESADLLLDYGGSLAISSPSITINNSYILGGTLTLDFNINPKRGGLYSSYGGIGTCDLCIAASDISTSGYNDTNSGEPALPLILILSVNSALTRVAAPYQPTQ